MTALVTTSKTKAADMVQCPYNKHHRVPATSLEAHKARCWLRTEGYTDKDKFLPEVFDPDAPTVVKLSPEEIETIIEEASKDDPLFRRGAREGAACAAPLTADRLRCLYTADERRTIHDAAVKMAAAPQTAELVEVTLPGSNKKQTRPKTRLEVLAELRNMKRRRTKYKVATKSKNYSEVLREVIKGQMELIAETQPKIEIKQEKDFDNKVNYTRYASNRYTDKYANYPKSRDEKRKHDYEPYGETSRVRIKRERDSSEEINKNDKSNGGIHKESFRRDYNTETRTRNKYEDDRYVKSSKNSDDKYDRADRYERSYRYKYDDYSRNKYDFNEQSSSHKRSDIYYRNQRSECDRESVDSMRDPNRSGRKSIDDAHNWKDQYRENRKRHHDDREYDKNDASYRDNRHYYKDDYDKHKKMRNEDYKKEYHHGKHGGKSREKSRVQRIGDYSCRDKASEKSAYVKSYETDEKGQNFQSYWATNKNITIKKEKSDDSSSSRGS